MNNDLIRTFIEVAKTRHFGNAAENLYLTQSAVSARIKQLESLIGTELFSRQRNNILLTTAGERLLPHAENLLASWQLAMQEVGVPTKKNTQITLGGTSNLWDTFLQSLLPRLATQFPNLYLRTEINTPQALVRLLLGGRLDVFATLNPPANTDFGAQAIGDIELIMVSKEAKIALDQLPQYGFVFVDWGTAFNIQQAKLFNEPVAPILHTAQSRIALEYILGHRGAAYLPRALVQAYLDEGNLYHIEQSPTVTQAVYAVYLKENEQTETLAPVLKLLEARDLKPDATLQPIATDN